jgi:hypothetical protein
VGNQVFWPWIAFLIGTGVAFGLLEWRGLKDPHDIHPPLTQVIKWFVPRWGLALGIGAAAFWALEHFVL